MSALNNSMELKNANNEVVVEFKSDGSMMFKGELTTVDSSIIEKDTNNETVFEMNKDGKMFIKGILTVN